MIPFDVAQKLVAKVLSKEDYSSLFVKDGCEDIIDKRGNIVHVYYDNSNSRLIAVSAIGKIPDDKEDAIVVLKYILEQNLLWKNTFGATLALAPDTSYVTIQRIFDNSSDSSFSFNQFIDMFSSEVQGWIDNFDRIKDLAEQGENPLLVVDFA